MADAYHAAQPTTVTGSVNSTNITMNERIQSFTIDDTAENFYGLFNNEKYLRDGGSVSFNKTVSIESYHVDDIEGNKGLKAGDFWTACVAVYNSEGPSADATDEGDLTVTIDQMRIDSSSISDGGGRMLISCTATATSSDGSTEPITYAVA